MDQSHTHNERKKETTGAAFSSVIAALLLTALKLIVGLSTNSLGILSEAAHSAFDLLAAGMTLFAVRYAANPADASHPYGHGKIENLSAFIEALLLLITCAWIIWESIDRLFFTHAPVEPSLWAFGVMIVSITVDIGRSRMLMHMAKKHKSQALEADALHFSTDIWSSAVVIVGLSALYVANWLPEGSALRPWLERADSLAALGVSFIIAKVSLSLGKQAINILLDTTDQGLTNTLAKTVQSVPGVKGMDRLRVRHSGPAVFVDVTIIAEGTLVAAQLASLQNAVEQKIHEVEPEADITVEIKPAVVAATDIMGRTHELAAVYGLDVHAIELLETEDTKKEQRHILQLHVEITPEETLENAHDQVSAFENLLRQEFPLLLIISHLEPKNQSRKPGQLMGDEEIAKVGKIINELLAEHQEVYDCHDILLQNHGTGQRISFHCRMAGGTTVQDAHDAANWLQVAIHKRFPELRQVTVHMEPLHTDE